MLNDILPRVKTETIGDIVLWLQPNSSELPKLLRLPKRFVAVVLAPRWSKEPRWRPWISRELRLLSKELGLALVFVPMTGSYDDDRDEHRAVAAELALGAPEIDLHVIEGALSPRAIASIFKEAALVVSMRLHGCVMAFAQETTCVGLAYHPKLSGFFQTVKWQEALLPPILPSNQSSDTYGYRFVDLEVSHGQLVREQRWNVCLGPILRDCLH